MKMSNWGQPRTSPQEEAALASLERSLTLLVDGAARGAVEVDSVAYKNFRANLDELARRIPDRLPEEEKFALLRSINQEFEAYRTLTENALREWQAAWRGSVSLLLEELLHDLGVDATSPKIVLILSQLKRIATTEEIVNWRDSVKNFLHPMEGTSPSEQLAARLRTADCSTANDNAAGLRGGGAAVEHLRGIMQKGGDGFIVLFRLSCLEIISQRFGAEAVEDCLMAVSAFLTAGLEGDDAIYHWSDSALLAILQGRPNEMILSAELERILAQNRESTIKIAGRAIMLRIPITFQLTPINRLRAAEDLLRISARQSTAR
jgi:GGDEF domain-containing protein